MFRAKGYSETTLSDIAEAVGVTRASLYYYFSSKSDIFRELVSDAIEANVLEAEHILNRHIAGPEAISELCHTLMRAYAAQYPYIYVYIQEEMHRLRDGSEWAKRMQRMNRRYQQAVVGIVQSGLDDGSFKVVGPAVLVAHTIMSILNGTHRWFDPAIHNPDDVAQMFRDMVLTGLEL